MWIYKQEANEPGSTFGDAAETLKARQNELTWNVLVDTKYAVQCSVTVGYLSDEDLIGKLFDEMVRKKIVKKSRHGISTKGIILLWFWFCSTGHMLT